MQTLQFHDGWEAFNWSKDNYQNIQYLNKSYNYLNFSKNEKIQPTEIRITFFNSTMKTF